MVDALVLSDRGRDGVLRRRGEFGEVLGADIREGMSDLQRGVQYATIFQRLEQQTPAARGSVNPAARRAKAGAGHSDLFCDG
jgi:hypothetical protein